MPSMVGPTSCLEGILRSRPPSCGYINAMSPHGLRGMVFFWRQVPGSEKPAKRPQCSSKSVPSGPMQVRSPLDLQGPPPKVADAAAHGLLAGMGCEVAVRHKPRLVAFSGRPQVPTQDVGRHLYPSVSVDGYAVTVALGPQSATTRMIPSASGCCLLPGACRPVKTGQLSSCLLGNLKGLNGQLGNQPGTSVALGICCRSHLRSHAILGPAASGGAREEMNHLGARTVCANARVKQQSRNAPRQPKRTSPCGTPHRQTPRDPGSWKTEAVLADF